MATTSLTGLAPLAAVLVLLELAVGTVAVSTALDCVAGVSRGFLGTTAAICAGIMGIDLLLLRGASDVAALVHRPVAAGPVAGFAHWAVAFTVLLLADVLFAVVGTDAARRVVAAATVAGGLVTVASAAAAEGPALGGVGVAAVAFVPAAFLAGAAFAGMLLGHWYLVSPAMSFRPLRLSIYGVFTAVLVDCVAIAISLLVATPPARARLLSGDQAGLFWLLVIGSGVIFTGIVNGLTLYFARMRANQPATAMLYVLIISVVMAIVPGHLIFFITGVPV